MADGACSDPLVTGGRTLPSAVSPPEEAGPVVADMADTALVAPGVAWSLGLSGFSSTAPDSPPGLPERRPAVGTGCLSVLASSFPAEAEPSC